MAGPSSAAEGSHPPFAAPVSEESRDALEFAGSCDEDVDFEGRLVVAGVEGRSLPQRFLDGFLAQVELAAPGGYQRIDLRVDGDGNVDAAVANSNQASASVIRGNGAGGLLPPVTYPAGNFPIAVDLGDLDGDTDLDLIVSNFGSANYTVYWNNGAGVLGSPFTLPAQSAGSCMLVVDTDHDGDVDLVGIDEVVDRFFVFNQIVAPAPGVQAASRRATLRVNDLAHHGGYAGMPPHPVSAGGSFFLGIGGAPNVPYSLAVGVPFEPGTPTPVGLLNLTFPIFFLMDGLGGNPSAVTDARGQDLERFVLPLGLPIGFTVGLQAVVAPVLTLSNPERIVVVP